MSEGSKTYHVIREQHGAPIVADYTRRYQERITALTALAGVPVKYPQVSEGMFGQWVNVNGIYADSEPTQDGWKPDRSIPGLYVPNMRRKAGKAISETLRGMDAGGLRRTLADHGVNPWPDFDSPFSSACAGYGRFDNTILLVWHDGWTRRGEWPAWVEEIKASEFYAIQEAYRDRHKDENAA